MAFRFGDQLGDLNAITPDDIVAFLCKLKAGSKPRRYKALPSHLRSLFKFLFWNGKTRRNLVKSLPRAPTMPLGGATTRCWLRAYRAERNRLLGTGRVAFFLLENGERPSDCCARYNFALVCQRISLRQPQIFNKHGRGPRIHDLRHTFAVRTIMDWYRRGLDSDREILKLSTYLGHTQPEHTYWYIEAIPKLLQLACERAEWNLSKREVR